MWGLKVYMWGINGKCKVQVYEGGVLRCRVCRYSRGINKM